MAAIGGIFIKSLLLDDFPGCSEGRRDSGESHIGQRLNQDLFDFFEVEAIVEGDIHVDRELIGLPQSDHDGHRHQTARFSVQPGPGPAP